MPNRYERTLDELQQLAAREALAREFDPEFVPSPKTQRELEILRGIERVAALELNARELPSDAREDGPRISPKERAERDAYRTRMQAQVDRG